MLKRIWLRIKGLFCKTKKNLKRDTYMNYLKKTSGTPKQQWDRILYVIKYPIVIISFTVGFGSIPFILLSNSIYIKTIFTALSSVGLGVGINYFTFYLKETREYKILNEIGSYTVRRLSSKIDNILSKETLNQTDKTEITDFLSLIDVWKDYIEFADTSKISYHKRLKLEIEQEQDINKKKLLENRKSSLEHNWAENGLGGFIDISGSTEYVLYDYNLPKLKFN